MPDDGRDMALIWDMLEAAEKAGTIARRMTKDDYIADPIAQLAMERAIEIIGEAARGISQDLQQSRPDVPWRTIIGQRHVIAHDYGEIDHDRLWDVATIHVPRLIISLRSILDVRPP